MSRADRAFARISDPLERKAAELSNRLVKAASEIKAEAAGRTCGGCAHHRDGWCAEVVDAGGDALEIGHPGAVACRSWSPAS